MIIARPGAIDRFVIVIVIVIGLLCRPHCNSPSSSPLSRFSRGAVVKNVIAGASACTRVHPSARRSRHSSSAWRVTLTSSPVRHRGRRDILPCTTAAFRVVLIASPASIVTSRANANDLVVPKDTPLRENMSRRNDSELARMVSSPGYQDAR